MTPGRIAELRLIEKHLRAGGQIVGACIGELLDHIAALETKLRIAEADRDRYHDERNAAMAKVSELMNQPSEAVVVPEPGDRVGWVRVDRWKNEGGRAVWVNLDEVLHAGRLRSIPADRVLGDGQVAANPDYIAALESAANQFCGTCRDKPTCSLGMMAIGKGCGAWRIDAARINALRSAQAGKGSAYMSERSPGTRVKLPRTADEPLEGCKHDWRYASRWTKPGFESRARCQKCNGRKWDPVQSDEETESGAA